MIAPTEDRILGMEEIEDMHCSGLAVRNENSMCGICRNTVGFEQDASGRLAILWSSYDVEGSIQNRMPRLHILRRGKLAHKTQMSRRLPFIGARPERVSRRGSGCPGRDKQDGENDSLRKLHRTRAAHDSGDHRCRSPSTRSSIRSNTKTQMRIS